MCLLLPAAFITLHLVTPSDGARLAELEQSFRPEGVVVSRYQAGQGGLQTGDLVTAVAGRPMGAWMEDLFRPGAPRPSWTAGQVVPYRVIRDGEVLDLAVRLGDLPAGAILGRFWGVLLFAFISQVVAALVLIQRPRDPAAQALFIWAMSGSHTYAWSFFLQIGDLVGGWGFWLFSLVTPGLWLIYWPASLHVALVFPRPLPLIRRWPGLVRLLYLLSLGLYAALLVWRGSQAESVLDWFGGWGMAEDLVALLFLSATLIAIVIQYRSRKSARERDQIRWAVFGAAVSGVTGLVLWLGAPALIGRSVISPNVLGLTLLPFPLSLAIAIWRHRLFDIDQLINRALVYTLLTGALVVVYLVAVILLQRLLPAQSQLAAVFSTLTIAGLFSPLRARIQTAIDRRFYRHKYDARQALASFNAAVRDELDLQELSEQLVEIVQATVQPERVALWLVEGEILTSDE